MTNINPSLIEERSKVKLNLDDLATFYYGSEAIRDHYFKVMNTLAEDPILKNDPTEFDLNRLEAFKLMAKKTARYHELFNLTEGGFKFPAHYNNQPLGSLHSYMFISTIKNLGNDKQIDKWLERAYRMEVMGCYAQTEMGHGSDVQSLETIATYDKQTDEFILHSPTLTSTKWWPGELAKVANHCVAHAQLYIDGKHYGLQTFIAQIRDLETHKVLPGIECGDIGPKHGYATKDNGYLKFNQYRIPRENMLMKFAKVNKHGEFVKTGNDKIGYATMMYVRSCISDVAGEYLSAAVTIATRYALVRTQFKNEDGKEMKIMDYQTQMEKIIPLIATCYAMKSGAQKLRKMYAEMMTRITENEDFSMLNDMHASLSGTKAFWTWETLQGIEISRLSCGGHGFLKASGFTSLYTEWSPNCTHEGENTVMALQTARYLIKCLGKLRKGNKLEENAKYLTFLNEILSVQTCPITSVDDFNIQSIENLIKANAAYLVYSSALKLGDSMKKGLKMKEAWNQKAGIELVEAARAHTLYFTFMSFKEKIDEVRDKNNKDMLTKLCELYALHRLLAHPLGLLECGYINNNQIKMLKSRKEDLLLSIRPQVIGLVDCWRIPDNSLKTCLGRYDGQVYEHLMDWAKNKNFFDKDEVIEGWKEYIYPFRHIKRPPTPKL